MPKKYSYPSSIIQTVNSVIKECAASSGIYPTQANPSQYLCLFFSYDNNYYIPENAFLCIWYNLIQFQRFGKSYWIKSYWEQAVSYANLHLDGYFESGPHDEDRQQLLFRFKQFHQVYCGYLLNSMEYELLAHMRDFSNSIPYSNCLVPDNLSEICEQMSALDPISNPLYMDSHYNFFQINGVKDGHIARAWAYRYYGICCLVKPQINLVLNYSALSIEKKIEFSNQIATLIHFISNDSTFKDVIKDPKFLQYFEISQETPEACIESLKQIQDDLQISIDSDKRNQTTPQETIQQFKTEVNEYVVKGISTSNLPVRYSVPLHEQSILKISDQIIDRDFFSEHPLISYLGFTEAYSSLIGMNISLKFANQIKLNSPRRKYYIDYFEIQEALNTLNLNENYCIISLGIELANHIPVQIPKDNVATLRTKYSEIIILPKEELPYLTLEEPPVNIDVEEIPNSAKNNIKATVAYKYNQVQFIHYVMLKVVYIDYEGISSQLKDIKPIQQLI